MSARCLLLLLPIVAACCSHEPAADATPPARPAGAAGNAAVAIDAVPADPGAWLDRLALDRACTLHVVDRRTGGPVETFELEVLEGDPAAVPKPPHLDGTVLVLPGPDLRRVRIVPRDHGLAPSAPIDLLALEAGARCLVGLEPVEARGETLARTDEGR